jgi:hypothetical protein
MELNITKFFSEANPAYYSASQAELGQNAGRITWENSVDAGSEWQLLKTPAEFDAMRAHAISSGGWSESEVDAWSNDELQALCIQWVCGDIREGFDWSEDARDGLTPWEFYESLAEAGQVASSLFRTDSGEIYWIFGEY